MTPIIQNILSLHPKAKHVAPPLPSLGLAAEGQETGNHRRLDERKTKQENIVRAAAYVEMLKQPVETTTAES